MDEEKYRRTIKAIQIYYKDTSKEQIQNDEYRAGKNFAYGLVLDLLGEEKPEVGS